MVNPYGLTDDEMILLEAMDLQERCIIPGSFSFRWIGSILPFAKGGQGGICLR
jgi:hypothetical protein